MSYLLDTHALLWIAADDARVSSLARTLFEDSSQELHLSSASIWEMAIKAGLGKLTLGMTLEQLVKGALERGVRVLEVRASHAYLVERLPFHHRDPFDRMLVAQASHEGMSVLSRDDSFDAYGVKRVW